MENKNNIDFKILLDKIHFGLNRKHQLIFNQWINYSSKNKSYFENLSRHLENGSNLDLSPESIEEDWNKLNASFKSVQKPVSRPYFKRLIAALIFISFMAGGASLFIQKFGTATTTEEENIVNELKPGKSQAILTLDNGKSYELNHDSGLEIDSKGVKIKSEGSSITYQKVVNDTGVDDKVKEKVSKKKLAYNVLEVPRGGEFYIELSDGTKVWINADSRLKYPVNFSDFDRVVEFIGEAYFEVASNTSKPFIVKSGMQEIKVLGTAFNLSSYDDDSEIITTLIEGNVSVKRAYGDNKSIFLKPNQQSIFTKRTGKIVSKKVDPHQFIAWKSGEFYFNHASMVAIMKVMERWYDIDVFFDSRKGTQLKYSGGFERFANFDKVQNIIEKSSDNKLTFKNKNKTVVIKYNI